MTREPQLSFPPFHLDLGNEQLWRGAELLPLRPKTFRLLRYLAEHPERLVTEGELLKAVWQRSYVSDGLLRAYVRELRKILGDEAKAPQFIETAPRRGYRFIAPVTTTPPVLSLKVQSRQHPTPCCRLRGEGAGVGATPRLARAGACG